VLGRALPLTNNPLFIAEEMAMLDNMSRGRMIAGFVRGIGTEYHSTGTNPVFSHERFHEAHDLIVQAWTRPGPFEFEGEHYNNRYVNLWPRPYQTPHPPIWVPSQGSSETIRWAAAPEHKYPFLVTFAAQDLVVRYRIDGLCQEKLRLPKQVANSMVTRLKIMCNLDISERRLPQVCTHWMSGSEDGVGTAVTRRIFSGIIFSAERFTMSISSGSWSGMSCGRAT
jgi:hypothetical protein